MFGDILFFGDLKKYHIFDVLFNFFRIAVSGYCSRIYKVPSDDVNNATKFKEAPVIDNTNITSDDQTLKDRENQSKYISIPEEVC